MKRIAIGWLIAPLLLLVAAPTTLAATIDEIADGLERDGYYIGPGAEQVDEQALRATVRDSRTELRPVLLAVRPPEGEDVLAEQLHEQFGGTIVVVTPTDLGTSTDFADQGQVDRAYARADQQVDSFEDLPGYLRAFDTALAAEVERDPAPTGTGGRGGVSVGVFLLVGGIIVLGGMALFNQYRTRKTERAQQERSLQEARQEVRNQVSALAERILALDDQVELANNTQASKLYSQATATFTAAQNHLEGSASVAELEKVSDELDHARWQMESVTALLEGREPPPEPEKEVSCFFDPNHGAGVEEAKIDTAAGEQKVRVCSYCAARLRAGEAPEPRMIEVGGQRVPAAMAPRSYGGGGLGWLADFALILGGRRYPYGWGGYRGFGWGYPRRRGWYGGGGWGGGWGAGRSSRGGWGGSGSWGTTSSSRRSRSRSGGRSTSSRGRSGGSRTRSTSSRSRGGGGRRR
jgi:hypothetical protein